MLMESRDPWQITTGVVNLKSNMPSSTVQADCRETVELLIEHSRR